MSLCIVVSDDFRSATILHNNSPSLHSNGISFCALVFVFRIFPSTLFSLFFSAWTWTSSLLSDGWSSKRPMNDVGIPRKLWNRWKKWFWNKFKLFRISFIYRLLWREKGLAKRIFNWQGSVSNFSDSRLLRRAKKNAQFKLNLLYTRQIQVGYWVTKMRKFILHNQ